MLVLAVAAHVTRERRPRLSSGHDAKRRAAGHAAAALRCPPTSIPPIRIAYLYGAGLCLYGKWDGCGAAGVLGAGGRQGRSASQVVSPRHAAMPLSQACRIVSAYALGTTAGQERPQQLIAAHRSALVARHAPRCFVEGPADCTRSPGGVAQPRAGPQQPFRRIAQGGTSGCFSAAPSPGCRKQLSLPNSAADSPEQQSAATRSSSTSP